MNNSIVLEGTPINEQFIIDRIARVIFGMPDDRLDELLRTIKSYEGGTDHAKIITKQTRCYIEQCEA